MIKVLMDLLVFLRTAAPFLTSLVIFTLLCILLSKSIKKHATTYYIILGIPFFMVAIPFIIRLFGVEVFSFTRVPVLGEIMRDYIHMAAFGHPLLVIIMYMGALDARNPYVKRLMSIRKELSIITGFPVLTHSLVRVINNFPDSLRYFTDHAGYMNGPRVTSELGSGISSFSLVLGIVMLALFIPLWVTSFGPIHRRMGNVKWKKLQKLSYVLYATLFIHAIGIQAGGMITRNAGSNEIRRTEVLAEANRQEERPAGVSGGHGRNGTRDVQADTRGQRDDKTAATSLQADHKGDGGKVAASSGRPSGGRVPVKGFSDFEVSAHAKQVISIISLLLVYGSYLYLRLRKAGKAKRSVSA